jgi:hypothetical protein
MRVESAGQADGDLQAEADRPAVDGRGDREIDGAFLAGGDGADVDETSSEREATSTETISPERKGLNERNDAWLTSL